MTLLHSDEDVDTETVSKGRLQKVVSRNLRNWPTENLKARNLRNWPKQDNQNQRKEQERIRGLTRPTGLKGNRILQFWSLFLTTLLLGFQQYFTIFVAISATPITMKEVLNWVFQEFTGPPWIRTGSFMIFGVSCLNTLSYSGLICLPALVALGISLIWVYYVVFLNLILLVVLAWYSDNPPDRDFGGQLMHNTNQTALYIFIPLGIHLAICIVRPLILMRSIPTDSAAESGGV